MNRSGVPIKTSMERQDALQHACLYENLREKCQAFLSKMEPPQLLTMLQDNRFDCQRLAFCEDMRHRSY
ncbi:uncharacterized protein LOC117190301 isoform X2 [Drosophila miranda]|nr:uncharacterized protein LOC117190301 isoform X2 [Drosophila miranda]